MKVHYACMASLLSSCAGADRDRRPHFFLPHLLLLWVRELHTLEDVSILACLAEQDVLLTSGGCTNIKDSEIILPYSIRVMLTLLE